MRKKKDNWKIWKIWKKSHCEGKMHYKRAIGKLPEMESAKAICKILSSFYKPKMKLLDVGCGAGHYLRSIRLRLDKNIDYTGLDTTGYYIKLARKAFGKGPRFLVGDILNLPFKSGTFDIVICCNLIVHLPPPPTKAISELIRVAKKYVVIRTTFGETTYIIKQVQSLNKKTTDLIDQNGEPLLYGFFNMYSEQYLRNIITKIKKNINIKIVKDDKWVTFDNRRVAGKLATRIIDGHQVTGNLFLDWRFIILKNEKDKNRK